MKEVRCKVIGALPLLFYCFLAQLLGRCLLHRFRASIQVETVSWKRKAYPYQIVTVSNGIVEWKRELGCDLEIISYVMKERLVLEVIAFCFRIPVKGNARSEYTVCPKMQLIKFLMFLLSLLFENGN